MYWIGIYIKYVVPVILVLFLFYFYFYIIIIIFIYLFFIIFYFYTRHLLVDYTTTTVCGYATICSLMTTHTLHACTDSCSVRREGVAQEEPPLLHCYTAVYCCTE